MDIRKIASRFDAAKDRTAKSRRHRRRVYLGMLLAAGVAAAPILSVRAAPEVSDTANKPGGDLRSQEIELRNAARANPNDPAIHLKLATLYLRLNNLPAAEAEVRLAQQNNASDKDVAPLLAEVLQLQNKVIELFQQVHPADRPAKVESEVRYFLGAAHLNLGEDNQAEPLLRDAERLDPTAWQPKLGLARLLQKRGDTAGAKAELDAAKAIAPDNIEVVRVEATMLLSQHDNAGALALFNKILAARPGDLGALYGRAQVKLVQNDLAGAGADVDSFLKIAPKNPNGLYLKAVVLIRKDEFEKADDALSNAVLLGQTAPNLLFLEGEVKIKLGQYKQAEEMLSRYVARVPLQPDASRLLAQLALRRGDRAAAIAILKPAVDKDPSDARSVMILARAYVDSGKKNEAIALYKQAAESGQGNPMADARLAFEQMQLGEPEAGISQLEKVEQTQPDFGGPLLVLAELRRGQLDQASAAAEALARKDPKDVIAQMSLGIVRTQQHRYDDAVKIFKDLLQTYPTLVQAQYSLAQVYRLTGRFDDAAAILKDILAKKPGDIDALTGLARTEADRKNYAAAAGDLQQAVADAPKNATLGIDLVQLYAEQKNWPKAIAAGKELAVRFPDDDNVADALAKAEADSGDAKAAATDFRMLSERKPGQVGLLRAYAKYQYLAGDKPGAIDTLQQAVSLAPGNLELLQLLADVVAEVKGADAALTLLRSFEQRTPVLAALVEAEVELKANRTANAAKTLTTALNDHPAVALAIRRAQVESQNGDNAGAVGVLEAWLKSHPGDDSGEVALGSAYLQAGQPAKAQAMFEKALESAPNNVIALNNLAWLYAQKNDPRARGLAEQAFTLAPGPRTADTLGWIVLEKGDAKTALTYLSPASHTAPDDPVVQYHLAAALKETGKSDEARAMLEKLLQSDVAFDGRDGAKQLLSELTRH